MRGARYNTTSGVSHIVVPSFQICCNKVDIVGVSDEHELEYNLQEEDSIHLEHIMQEEYLARTGHNSCNDSCLLEQLCLGLLEQLCLGMMRYVLKGPEK